MSDIKGTGVSLGFVSMSSGFTIGGMPASNYERASLESIPDESITATIEVDFNPPINDIMSKVFPAGSLLCEGYDQYEITCPPTERQLKRHRRRLRRNKRRANGTRRKKSQRGVKIPRGAYFNQYMRVKMVEQDGDTVSLTMEAL